MEGKENRNGPLHVYCSGNNPAVFCDGEVVDVGNTEGIIVEGLAHRVKERSGSSSSIAYVPYDHAYEPGLEDMMRRVPSLEKLYALTGFRPATSLNEIIDSVAGYFRETSVAVEVRKAAGNGDSSQDGTRCSKKQNLECTGQPLFP